MGAASRERSDVASGAAGRATCSASALREVAPPVPNAPRPFSGVSGLPEGARSARSGGVQGPLGPCWGRGGNAPASSPHFPARHAKAAILGGDDGRTMK